MLTVTTPPAAEPVSAAELKARLRVTHAAEDDLIAALLPAARLRVEAELGLALAPAAFRETFDGWRATVTLARGPLTGVVAVAAGDGAGGWTALDASAYAVSADDRPTRIARPGVGIDRGVVLGAGLSVFGAGLRVDYAAGFAALPASLREAVLALAVEAYERRGDPAPTLAAAEPWLAAWRRGRL